MRLSSKSEGDRVIRRGDFHGGLNTITVPEMIADNQLAECVNMDFNKSTGALQTSSGSITIFKTPANVKLTDCFYDKINNIFIVVDSNRNIYKTHLIDMVGDGTDFVRIGSLNGDKKPMAVMWEHGLLIASGGKLQYWTGLELKTIASSPAVCNGVFVKNGRVWIWYKYTLVSSGVGDEENWTDTSSDDSTSKWIDVGYKEGEEGAADIVGVTALSSDIIIIKADGKIYRLTGNYPNWNLLEVARNINILNRNCYTAIQDGVFILSRDSLFYLQTTQNYGDIQPQNIAVNINNLFSDLDIEETKMVFIPILNQIWITSRGGNVIIFDVTFRAFLQRNFKNRVMDLVTDYFSVLLVKADKVTRLMNGVFYDELYSSTATPVNWRITAKTDTSFYNYLLKRVRVAYVPFSDTFQKADVIMAKGKIEVPIPEGKIKEKFIREITTNIVDDDSYIFPNETQFNTKWMVYRDRSFDMKARGVNAPLMINKIDSDLVEVG